MRLPVENATRILALGLTAAVLAGCGLVGGDERPAALAPLAATALGPAADYPIVLGDPFTLEGELYTPADVLNYDAVGYAALDPQGGEGVTVAHKTLPLPSYVEVTALDSGRTILARVEQRGPMTGARLVALSRGAQQQLGVGEGAPVRVRRVNPPEAERAELRAGRPAPERMEMPKALAEVLRRKLPEGGAASLRSAAVANPVGKSPPAVAVARPAPHIAALPAPVQAAPAPAERTPAAAPKAVSAYPLPPLANGSPRAMVPAHTPRSAAQPAPPVSASNKAGFVIQAAAFSSKANAERAAAKLNGFVTPAGQYFRVRTGPYATRGQAEAALAKVRAAGYSDAKVFTAG